MRVVWLRGQLTANIINSYAEVTGTVQARSNVSRAVVGGLVGDAQNSFFNNTYAVVDGNLNAVSAAMHRNATAGGLVGFTNGETRLLHSYAVVRGNVSARQETDASLTTYAGGLVGAFGWRGSLALNDSYANASVLDANVTDVAVDAHRTLAQLQCPTMPNATCQDARRTYFGWNDQIWDFGDNLTLPTIVDVQRRDIDDDDVGDLDDNCPQAPNADQANLDNASGDRLGDVCDDDIDGDGLANTADNCPRIASTNQTDLDNDGMGDVCDDDDDGDLVPDTEDNCPRVANADQANLDNATGDSMGDACDDIDGDGITDAEDNCPRVASTNRTDLDNDGMGDVCDDDIDGDGVPNTNNEDRCPRERGPIDNNGCPEDGGMPDPGPDPGPDPMLPPTDGGPEPVVIPSINITAQQLLNNLTHPSGFYRLTDNLTVTTPWTSIDFNGTLDGANHTIANLSAPLFDTIDRSAAVANLGILGSILANQNDGNVSWVYATGNVNSSSGDSGGLVGQNHGRISYSYATGNVDHSDTNSNSGGLVGTNAGTIVYSYATGNIHKTDLGLISAAGGLVGVNAGVINRSYAIGDASTMLSLAGGLVGLNGNSD